GTVTPPAGAQPTNDAANLVEDENKKLLTMFSDMIQVPQYLQPWYARFGTDRKYLNELSMRFAEKAQDDDVVATNYIYRYQRVFLSNVLLKDPQCLISPENQVGPAMPGLAEYCKTGE